MIVGEPVLKQRINHFMSRKVREFPELKQFGKWDKYELWPKRPNTGRRMHAAM